MSNLFNDFNIPSWSFEFKPSKSELIDDNTIYKLIDTGSIGIDAVQSNSNFPVTLVKNVFGYDYGAYLVTPNQNRDFTCNSTSAYDFLHNDTDSATLFAVVEPELDSFLYVLGNTRISEYDGIGIAIGMDNSPSQLRVAINNGSGTDNSAYVVASVPASPGLMVIAVKKTTTNLYLWLNGSLRGSDSLDSPSSSDSTDTFRVYGTVNSVGSLKGYGGTIQCVNSALSDDFIEQYSKFLYEKNS